MIEPDDSSLESPCKKYCSSITFFFYRWVDFINLKSYNFQDLSENATGFNAPLFAPVGASEHTKERCVVSFTFYKLHFLSTKSWAVLNLK